MIRILLSNLLGERKWTQTDLVRKTGIRLIGFIFVDGRWNTHNQLIQRTVQRITDEIQMLQAYARCEFVDPSQEN